MYIVKKNKSGKWIVIEEGAKRASKVCDSKTAAIEYASKKAKKESTTFIVDSDSNSSKRKKSKYRLSGMLLLLIILVIVGIGIFLIATGKINLKEWFSKEDQTHSPAQTSEGIIYDQFQIHFMELGNKYTGDATYIKAGDVDILIDAGSRKDSAEEIKQYIDSYCDDGKLEFVIATHAHQDHIAGFVGSNSGDTKTGIYYQYQIGTIIDYSRSDATSQLSKDYVTAREYAINNGAKHYTAEECFNNENGASNTYTFFEGCQMTILYNYYYFNSAASTEGGENNYSVCTLFTYQEHSFLLTGDLEKEGEEKLAEYYQQNEGLGHVDLFKAGHHGSKTSSNDCLLDIISPDICCVCCCAGSTEYTANYNNIFPTQAFISRIAKYTDQVYVTTLFNENTKTFESMNGDIIVSCNGKEVGLAASNNLTKLKDTNWFNQTIYVDEKGNICSGKGKENFFTEDSTGVKSVPRRIWPAS